MSDHTAIEWTDATWNPVTGCTKVSAGCDNCYAERLANRLLKKTYLKRLPIADSAPSRRDPFAVRLWPERLRQPGAWRDPRRIFVNSMSDLFHKDVPNEYIRRVFSTMLDASQHTYQVLTKRPSRALRFWQRNTDLFDGARIPAHIWMGTSVENGDVMYRCAHLRSVPAITRFLSCEPLLGPLSLDLTGMHWVIVGGESGPGFRPMKRDWVACIQKQCYAAGVPFFFKQWGGLTPKAGGRLLDGRQWNEYPPEDSQSTPPRRNAWQRLEARSGP